MTLEEHPAVQKAIWASYRLAELREAIEEYSSQKPYIVRLQPDSMKPVWELVFTQPVPQRIGFMAGDYFYNERASLDYLAASLVPKNMVGRSYFPILEKRIWEIPEAANEDENLRSQRQRWRFIEENMPPEAVQILKQLQPENSQPKVKEPIMPITILNRLSNADRHRTFTFVRESLTLEGTARFIHDDGHEETYIEGPTDRPRAYKNGAVFKSVPGSVRNIELNGQVQLLFKAGEHLVSTNQLQEVHEWVLNTIGVLTSFARND